MAGSLAHLIGEDGAFTMDGIDNMGDAHEALDECYHIILYLSGGDMRRISAACDAYNYPDPYKAEYGEPIHKPMNSRGKL